MVDYYIKIVKIIPILVVIFFIYILYKFKIWKLLPKESKIIMILLVLYVITNQIIDIIIEDTGSRIILNAIVTLIYLFSILVIFLRFYKKIKSKNDDNKLSDKDGLELYIGED
jgi:ABC-type amino acid transport system permease subunit